jgi:hypothetical protein
MHYPRMEELGYSLSRTVFLNLFFERGALFSVVSPRGTLTYEPATLRETRACTRTVAFSSRYQRLFVNLIRCYTFQPPTCASWAFRH